MGSTKYTKILHRKLKTLNNRNGYSIKQVLDFLVEQRNLSLSDIATHLDMSYHTVYAWYTGRRRTRRNPPKSIMKDLYGLTKARFR